MADNSGICYTWSGDKKIYESGELSISPDEVKFTDFDNLDNQYAVPVISNIFTSSNNPPGISLEEGTAMYTVGLRDTDIDINNNNYLTYTPPDGYELVSEDNKNDPGVKEYYMSREFYCDPSITVYYGTAAKSFTYLTGGKTFYYKKSDIHIKYEVNLFSRWNAGYIRCESMAVRDIPGTNNGDVQLGIRVQLYDQVDLNYNKTIYFYWYMNHGIRETRYFSSTVYYSTVEFTTQHAWESDNGDGSKTYYNFVVYGLSE